MLTISQYPVTENTVHNSFKARKPCREQQTLVPKTTFSHRVNVSLLASSPLSCITGGLLPSIVLLVTHVHQCSHRFCLVSPPPSFAAVLPCDLRPMTRHRVTASRFGDRRRAAPPRLQIDTPNNRRSTLAAARPPADYTDSAPVTSHMTSSVAMSRQSCAAVRVCPPPSPASVCDC